MADSRSQLARTNSPRSQLVPVSTRKSDRVGLDEFRRIEAAGKKCRVFVRVGGRPLKGDMVDFQAGLVFSERQLRIDGNAIRLQLQVQNDLRLRVPVQRIIAADTEIDR